MPKLNLTSVQKRLTNKWLVGAAVSPALCICVVALSTAPILLMIILLWATYVATIFLYACTVVQFSSTPLTAVSLYILFVAAEVWVSLSIVTMFARMNW